MQLVVIGCNKKVECRHMKNNLSEVNPMCRPNHPTAKCNNPPLKIVPVYVTAAIKVPMNNFLRTLLSRFQNKWNSINVTCYKDSLPEGTNKSHRM